MRPDKCSLSIFGLLINLLLWAYFNFLLPFGRECAAVWEDLRVYGLGSSQGIRRKASLGSAILQ